MNKKSSIGSCFAGSIAIGFTVWALSPYITGHAEPWDSNFAFYSLGMVIPAAVLGFFVSKRFGFAYLGVWFGQVVALAVLPGLDRGWLILGVFTTALGSLLGLFGYAIGSAISIAVSNQAPKHSANP